MNHAILVELQFFATSVFWGMILLILYDVLRIVRRIIKHNVILVGMQDIIYWIICSILIFHMMYQQNDGIIRGFSIMAMLIGMMLYHNLISDKFVDLVSKSINKILNLIKKFIILLFKPFIVTFNKIIKIITWIFKKLKKLLHYFIKTLKKIWKSIKINVLVKEKGD